jgi:3-deoxy-D-manno-octulosonic-acid transferase
MKSEILCNGKITVRSARTMENVSFFTKSIVQQVQIVNVKGIDYIDNPRNKSGLEDRLGGVCF